MKALKKFEISRSGDISWQIEIEDENGAVMNVSATFEDLDRLATALDEHFATIVEAAAKLETNETH